jgi:DNA-binding transcriptional LysR family regulator
MDFKQVEYFIALINSGSFSRAAENLYMSQPSLSKQIKALEIELGVDLFNRKAKGCTLTEAGELFLAFAQQVRKEQNDFINALGICTASTAFTIKLGALPIVSLPTYKVSSMIADFQAQYFQYTVEYIESDQHNLLNMLKESKIELAIGRVGDENDKNLDILPLYIDKFVVVLHRDHPLSTRKFIGLEELGKENFIQIGHQSAIFALCINAFKAANISPKITHTNTRHKIVLEMVSKNLGITLLPKNMMDNNPKLRAIKLKKPFYSTVALVRLKGKEYSPPSLFFWKYIKDNYALGK